jgi:hypothetical protein
MPRFNNRPKHVRASVKCFSVNFSVFKVYIQGVPGVKITNSGFNSRADSESKISYTHGSTSRRFWSYEFLIVR